MHLFIATTGFYWCQQGEDICIVYKSGCVWYYSLSNQVTASCSFYIILFYFYVEIVVHVHVCVHMHAYMWA